MFDVVVFFNTLRPPFYSAMTSAPRCASFSLLASQIIYFYPERPLEEQVSITLAVASTSIVPSRLRGKLSGLYGTAESFGRFTSAVGFAVLFAWSISSTTTGLAWVDHRLVFYTSALALGAVTMVAWRALPADIFRERDAAAKSATGFDDGADLPKAETGWKYTVPGPPPTGETDLV